MNVKILRKLIKNLQKKIKCPNCRSGFENSKQIEFRGYLDNTYFLQLKCSKCPTVVFATVVITKEEDILGKPSPKKKQKRPEVDGLEMGGDDLRAEAINVVEKINRFRKDRAGSGRKVKKIKSDDIIDFHEQIEDFDGDFTAYFGKL